MTSKSTRVCCLLHNHSAICIFFNFFHFVFHLIGFLIDFSFNAIHSIAEFAHTTSKPFAYLRNSFCPEKKKHHQHNDQNLASAQIQKQQMILHEIFFIL